MLAFQFDALVAVATGQVVQIASSLSISAGNADYGSNHCGLAQPTRLPELIGALIECESRTPHVPISCVCSLQLYASFALCGWSRKRRSDNFARDRNSTMRGQADGRGRQKADRRWS
jgi:hypothetical protein